MTRGINRPAGIKEWDVPPGRSKPVSIQSVSFWQQDQNYWQQAHAQSQASSADAALINVMAQAETNLGKGLASIANQTALSRVNNQISSLVQQALDPSSASSTSSSSAASGASSSANPSATSSSSPTPATATGTVPLTTSTSLSTLGILAGGKITISSGATTTKYTSTGTDTVANLINAINVDLSTNANVSASLNSRGQLVITSRNDTNPISIGGTYASNIGFAVGNNFFKPTAAASSASTTASPSTSSTAATSKSKSSSSGSSPNTATSAATSTNIDPSLASQSFSTAASLLSAEGVGGTLVDMLA
jgi:hypothetical protein